MEDRHASKMDKRGVRFYIEEGAAEQYRKSLCDLNNLEDINLSVYPKTKISKMDLEAKVDICLLQLSKYRYRNILNLLQLFKL